jgi:hypothetical protein
MGSAAAADKVGQVIAGELPWAALDEAERAAANAAIDIAISERASTVSFAQELLDAGRDAVVLDDSGAVVCLHPDGTVTPL